MTETFKNGNNNIASSKQVKENFKTKLQVNKNLYGCQNILFTLALPTPSIEIGRGR